MMIPPWLKAPQQVSKTYQYTPNSGPKTRPNTTVASKMITGHRNDHPTNSDPDNLDEINPIEPLHIETELTLPQNCPNWKHFLSPNSAVITGPSQAPPPAARSASSHYSQPLNLRTTPPPPPPTERPQKPPPHTPPPYHPPLPPPT